MKNYSSGVSFTTILYIMAMFAMIYFHNKGAISDFELISLTVTFAIFVLIKIMTQLHLNSLITINRMLVESIIVAAEYNETNKDVKFITDDRKRIASIANRVQTVVHSLSDIYDK